MVLVRFPFSVIYGAERETSLFVAVAHQRRKPGYWHGRVGRQPPLPADARDAGLKRNVMCQGNAVE